MQQWLQSIGFPSSIELDGAVHRISRVGRTDKSAWYIGWRDPIITVVAGDWRTGEKWRFSETENISSHGRREMREHVRKAMEEAERERGRKQELVALRAETTFRYAATTGSTSYLARKRVAAFGIYFLDDEVLVPVRDILGKTWGYQRILPDGTKLFLPGGKVEGCFHLIEGESWEDYIFIAEGYATAASVHMALFAPVVCAYHAGNLPKVAAAIRDKYPDVHIVICADDDQWTQGNPGRSKAQLAANAVKGRVVLPVFKDLEGRPTDFNDLHCREGLDAVRRALTK